MQDAAKGIFRSNTFRMLLVALTGFAALFVLNHFTPFISDDYGYSMVSSVQEAFNWSVLGWFNTNGRAPMTFLLYLFHLLPPWGFDIFNSLLFPLLCWLIAVLAKGSVKKVTAKEYAIVSLAGFFALPMIGSTCLWAAGAASYLWPATLVLAFILPYRLWSPHRDPQTSMPKRILVSLCLCVLMFMFGLLAGWSTECTGIGAATVTTLFMVVCFKEKRPLPAWVYAGWLSSIIGVALVVFAPGVSVRKANTAALLGSESSSILGLLKTNLPRVPFNTVGHNLPFVLFALFALFVLWKAYKQPSDKRWPILFLVGSIVSLLPAFVNASSRAQFFGGVLALTAFFALTFQLEGFFSKKVVSRFVIVLSLLGVLAFGLGLADTLRLYRYDLARRDAALGQINAGETDEIKLPALYTPRWMVLNQWSATWEESGYGMSIPDQYIRTLGGETATYVDSTN